MLLADPERIRTRAADLVRTGNEFLAASWMAAERSLRIAARNAWPFVEANFGIAIAARMPMITTTMSSSIRVKPDFRVLVILLHREVAVVRGEVESKPNARRVSIRKCL